MEFFVKSGSPEKQKTGCLIVGVFESRKLSAPAQQIDDISEGYINSIVKRGDMEGKFGQTLLLHSVPGASCDRVLLVGCGKEREFDAIKYKKICGKVIKLLNETGATDAINSLPLLNVKGQELYSKVRFAVEAANDSLYVFDQLKSEKPETRRPLRKMTLFIESRGDLPEGEKAIKHASSITAGQSLTRDLANLPGNICNPTYLANTAEELAKEYSSITTNILDESELKEMGAGAFVSVSQGSDEPGKLICMEYNGGTKGDKPLVFVGKGITFDTGGISLKPGAKMDEMKFDMGGAASVFGLIKSVAEMGLPINVIGVVAAAENMPSGNASRPGDVVTSLSGQTIEILNTDAEGRLVLCDVLWYAQERFNPAGVIDLATLTGAIIIGLGHDNAGVFSNDDTLCNAFLKAAQTEGEGAWRMPLGAGYDKLLKSRIADMKNIGGRPAGSITAAQFLQRFIKDGTPWIHLDIAGVASVKSETALAPVGATGWGVAALNRLISNLYETE